MDAIPLARTRLGEAEHSAVGRVLTSGRLARGPEIAAFEAEFARFQSQSHACSIASGTAGISVVLAALGIGPGDEVLLPALTFVGSVNAILACGATPVLCDVDEESWNIDPNDARRRITSRTRAILVVHLFGLPADLAECARIAAECGLELIEDACEAMGAETSIGLAGSVGTAGGFGFYPNKVVTTGEGGMIVTDDRELHERCQAIANQGRDQRGHFVARGHSLRMTELGAAVGRAQLSSLAPRLRERVEIAERIAASLRELPVRLPCGTSRARSWFTFPIVLPDGSQRSRIVEAMAARGVETAPHFPALHRLGAPYAWLEPEVHTPVAESVGGRLLCLPMWEGMESVHLARVADALREALK